MSMTVIIGNATQVSLNSTTSHCVLSVNWGFEPGRQDAFCLNEWVPSNTHTLYKPQETMSVTLYAPGPNALSVAASTSCTDVVGIQASVSPGSCNSTVAGLSGGNWLVTSYSYTKESKDQPGQESWSLVRYKGASSNLTGQAKTNAVEPSAVLRGAATGQCTDESITGIDFQAEYASAYSGNVSANAIGKATTMIHGIVSNVGGGSSDVSKYGTGSASIPLNPIYMSIT